MSFQQFPIEVTLSQLIHKHLKDIYTSYTNKPPQLPIKSTNIIVKYLNKLSKDNEIMNNRNIQEIKTTISNIKTDNEKKKLLSELVLDMPNFVFITKVRNSVEKDRLSRITFAFNTEIKFLLHDLIFKNENFNKEDFVLMFDLAIDFMHKHNFLIITEKKDPEYIKEDAALVSGKKRKKKNNIILTPVTYTFEPSEEFYKCWKQSANGEFIPFNFINGIDRNLDENYYGVYNSIKEKNKIKFLLIFLFLIEKKISLERYESFINDIVTTFLIILDFKTKAIKSDFILYSLKILCNIIHMHYILTTNYNLPLSNEVSSDILKTVYDINPILNHE